MQFKNNLLIPVFLGVNVISLGVVASIIISQRILSDSAIAARNKGLVTLAQHVKASTCWKDEASQPFKLNDPVSLAGTVSGKIPTGCIYAPKVQQFLQVAYLGNQLKVVQVYSRQEVRNQLTIKDTDGFAHTQNTH